MIKKELVLFLFCFIIYAILTKSSIGSWNDASRFATIKSLVEEHSFIIDNALETIPTGDKAFINGHFYSDKPPVFSIMAALPYFLLNLFGAEFSSFIVYITNLFVIGLSSVITLVFIYKSCSLFNLEYKHKISIVLITGFATLLFPYSLTLNNHAFAAMLLTVSFYLLIKMQVHQSFIRDFFILGFCLGLATTVDLVSGGIFIAVISIYFALTKISINKKIIYLLGIFLPLFIHLILNISITGDLKPVHLHEEYFQYSGAQLTTTGLSGISTTKNLFYLFWYTFHLLFGLRGLFLYSPILLFAVYYLLKQIKNTGSKIINPSKIILICITLIIAYYALFTKNLSGINYGVRWFVSFTPILSFYNSFFFLQVKARKIFYLLTGISLIIALIGVYDPWSAMMSVRNFPIAENLKNIISF